MTPDSDYFKKLDNIFVSLFGVQIILITISYIAYSEELSGRVEISRNILTILAMAVNSLIIIMARMTFFFSQSVKESAEKLEKSFRHKSFVRMYIIAVGNLFNISAFYISGDLIYLGVSALILILFLIYRPNQKLFEKVTKA